MKKKDDTHITIEIMPFYIRDKAQCKHCGHKPKYDTEGEIGWVPYYQAYSCNQCGDFLFKPEYME